MTEFKAGEVYIAGTGNGVTIDAVDSIMVGSQLITVIAYHFTGRKMVHIRKAEDAQHWRPL